MAEAVKLNTEETNGSVTPFRVPGPVGKIGEYWRRSRAFLHDVRVEMRQVNWPSRSDVWSTTVVVTITVAFFGVFFWVSDGVFSRLYLFVSGYFHHH
ncbi:MAG TPA: preprotein translocase subunit SecE [Candidatus Acidoferrales bacterium]|nr:preprotein translocase subunit SecE [Candidatus Acidoferrales bacterium]